jgi:hypothetical protein
MTLEPISGSSNVKATGHDAKTNTIYVQFHNGKVWKYPGFTAAHHQALRAAPSVGSHFHKHVKLRCECAEEHTLENND